jgi:hypothetical protein
LVGSTRGETPDRLVKVWAKKKTRRRVGGGGGG